MKEETILLKNKKILREKHKACEFCGSDNRLEVHHIIPLALGGSNNLGNLIVVCKKCHNKLHVGNRSLLVNVAMGKKEGKVNNE